MVKKTTHSPLIFVNKEACLHFIIYDKMRCIMPGFTSETEALFEVGWWLAGCTAAGNKASLIVLCCSSSSYYKRNPTSTCKFSWKRFIVTYTCSDIENTSFPKMKAHTLERASLGPMCSLVWPASTRWCFVGQPLQIPESQELKTALSYFPKSYTALL